MADILIKCEQCGHERKISEYAAGDDLHCLECDAELTVPEVSRGGGLRVREPQASEESLLVESKPSRADTREREEFGTDALKDVYRERKSVKTTRVVWGWLAFLLLTGIMIWLQMGVAQNAEMLNTYNWVRGIVGGLIYLLVIVVAFEDHVLQGCLALFIPPYCIYYALIRLDAYVLRNLFLAVFVSFIAEAYFIPEHALVTHLQQGVTSFLAGGSNWIDSAGDAPTFE